MGEVGTRDEEDAIAGATKLGEETAESRAGVGVSAEARADGERHDHRPGAGARQQRQLDLQGVLLEVGVVVGREGRAKVDDVLRQIAVHGNLTERSPPRPAGPDAHTGGRRLMVRAGEHDRRGRHLADELPGKRRDGSGVDQARVWNETAEDGLRGQASGPRHGRGAVKKRVDQPREAFRIGRVERARDRRRARAMRSNFGRSWRPRPELRRIRRPRPRRPIPRRVAHLGASERLHSASPTPAREWPQRPHSPSTRPARTAWNPRRRISVSPHSAQ